MRQKASFARGLWTGAVAGVAGSLVMTAFQEVVARSQRVPEEGGADSSRRYQVEEDENTTEKTARQVAEHYGRTLDAAQRQRAGRALHYGFGLVMGALYGVAAEYVPLVSMGAGSAFGTVLFAATDVGALPGLELAKQPGETSATDHVLHWGAHVAYAMAMESTREQLARLV